MDKFEKLIKDAVEGYEAPFDPKAWDDVSNDLNDSFDQAVKESTSNYEAPYDPAAWEAVSSQLSPAQSTWKWVAGAAAVVAVVAGTSYFSDTTENDKTLPTTTTTEIAENKTVEDHTIVAVEEDKIIEKHTTEYNAHDLSEQEENHISDVIHAVEPEDRGSLTVVNEEDDFEVEENNGDTDAENTTTPHNNDVVEESDQNTGEELNNDPITYKATADFEVKDAVICVGETCVFTPNEVNSKLLYIWNFGDGAISSNELGKHNYRRAGEYEVTLAVKHPRTNKTLASASRTIIVNALPNTDFTWQQSSEAIPNIQFINLTNEATNWNWDIKGVKSSSKNDFQYTFRKAGEYVVELTAVNAQGCEKAVQKTIKIDKDYNLLAPKAFSPNGDGENDFFIPVALKIMDVEFTMTIMDKSGKPVYTTRNAYEPWDGRYTKDNTLAPNGSSYIWRVVLTNKNGEQEMYEGQVFVIR